MFSKPKELELTLPDSEEKLRIRQINASKAIMLLGYVPDFSFTDKTEGQEAKAPTVETLQAVANWACAGIIEHGSKRIVPTLEAKEDEQSYFDLSELDKQTLFGAVVSMDTGKKK